MVSSGSFSFVLREGMQWYGEPEFMFRDFKGERIYSSKYPTVGPARAVAVLAGPLGLERSYAFLSWVKLARLLARAGFEAWTFDWRGQGESTGRFEDFDFEDWQDDVDFMIGEAEKSGLPVVLLGLRFGGLLASRAFARGLAHGLVVWDPVVSGEAMLQGILRRKLTSESMEGLVPRGTTRQSYTESLSRGETLMVEGFLWTKRLWESSRSALLAIPKGDETRPFQFVHMANAVPLLHAGAKGHVAVPIPLPPFWSNDPTLLPALDGLFAHSGNWLETHFARMKNEVSP